MQLITPKSFSDLLQQIDDFASKKKLAVAVSGGGDSMALAFLLSKFADKHDIELHVLTVDHGLRKESKSEARQVMDWVRDWHAVTPKILTWKTKDKPKTRIQEEARKARYELMAEYCRKRKIKHLFLAHHGDDQVETFLFRLAKGSGVDGLSVMPVLQSQEDVTLVRPLLSFGHEDLISFCKKNKLGWIEDPSNYADKFARVRLRQSKDILEKEGLTVERILTLAKRIERSRRALEQLTEKAEEKILLKKEMARIEIDLVKLKSEPKEIAVRILQRAIQAVAKKRAYPPSLKNIEAMADQIYDLDNFKAATLAGCVIRLKKTRHIIEVITE